MHPELQHLLVLLAVVHLLVLAAAPAPAPWARTRPADARLTDWLAATRPPRPRAEPPDQPTPVRLGSPTLTQPIIAAGDRGALRRTRTGRRSRPRPRGAAAGVKWRTRPRPGELYVAALNAQSLKPHLLELRQNISEHAYDLIAISETWLRPATSNRLIPVPGYQVHRKDRADGRGYGGVAVLVRDGLEVTVLNIAGRPVEGTGLESLWVRVRAGARRSARCTDPPSGRRLASPPIWMSWSARFSTCWPTTAGPSCWPAMSTSTWPTAATARQPGDCGSCSAPTLCSGTSADPPSSRLRPPLTFCALPLTPPAPGLCRVALVPTDGCVL